MSLQLTSTGCNAVVAQAMHNVSHRSTAKHDVTLLRALVLTGGVDFHASLKSEAIVVRNGEHWPDSGKAVVERGGRKSTARLAIF